MNIYEIQIPKFAPATFYKKDGVYYHTQDPEHPKELSQNIWNSSTKTIHRINDKITYTINCPLIMCTIQNFREYVDHELVYLKESLSNHSELVNIFVCHSDLRTEPIYVGFFTAEGIGEDLW